MTFENLLLEDNWFKKSLLKIQYRFMNTIYLWKRQKNEAQKMNFQILLKNDEGN